MENLVQYSKLLNIRSLPSVRYGATLASPIRVILILNSCACTNPPFKAVGWKHYA